MKTRTVLPRSDASEHGPGVLLLLAGDDGRMRSLLASGARDTVEAIAVLDAEDGTEAVQPGLQQQPHVALLDVNMPKLGGIEVALIQSLL